MKWALRNFGSRNGIGLSLIVLLAAPATLFLSTTACVTSGSSDRSAAVPDRASHAVHSDELVRVMSRIERVRRQSWPQEVEAEYESDRITGTDRAFTQAEQLAAQLSQAAQQIAGVVKDVEMADADRNGFLAQVGVFRSQVKQLETVASQRDAEAMRRTLKQIDVTCQSCHTRFRDVAGPID